MPRSTWERQKTDKETGIQVKVSLDFPIGSDSIYFRVWKKAYPNKFFMPLICAFGTFLPVSDTDASKRRKALTIIMNKVFESAVKGEEIGSMCATLAEISLADVGGEYY